jgi:hypothetical protein
VLIGLTGLTSRLVCLKHWNTAAVWFTNLFAFGVIAHALFRVSLYLQLGDYSNPLLVLFLTDLGLMATVMVQLHKWK